ncbi:hypothetical protein D9M73_198270 [compost metagenome]
MLGNIGGRPGAIVDHANLDWQWTAWFAGTRRDRHAVAIGSGERDPRIGLITHRFAGIFEQVEHHLQRRITVDLHWRQRRIEALLDHDVPPETGQRDTAGMIQKGIDILGRELQRPRVGEVLHPVD